MTVFVPLYRPDLAARPVEPAKVVPWPTLKVMTLELADGSI